MDKLSSEQAFNPAIMQKLAIRFSGKWLLRSEILLDEPLFHQLLKASHFQETPSIQRSLLGHQCMRCGNRKKSLIGFLPCKRCGKTHRYCRKCIEMGRIMACEPLYQWAGPDPDWPVSENPCTWEGSLTGAQAKAADRVAGAIAAAEKELLVWAVCGAGKTEMLFPGITKALQQGKRICIATPRADVVRELFPRIQSAFNSVHVQALYGGSKDNDGTGQIILATTHQLLRFASAFDVLVIDEIDAFPFHADPALPYAAARAGTSVHTTIFLTATPRKKQQIKLARKKLPHVFVPLRFHGQPLPVPHLHMCFSLDKHLRALRPPPAFMQWIRKRQNPIRQLLIFLPTISLAENMHPRLATLLMREGLLEEETDMEAVHASDADREEKVEKFRKKATRMLLTTTILERGVTFPSVDVVVLDAGHVVFDEAALVQIAGRAGRSPDDPTGEVVFFHDGKTEAMTEAVRSIQKMNKRGGGG